MNEFTTDGHLPTNRPLTGDAVIDGCTARFAAYYRNFWMRNDVRAMLNHWLNRGPRTTNWAKGFVNGRVNRYSFGRDAVIFLANSNFN